MSDAEQFLEAARKSFGLASNSTEAKAVAHYAEMGREFLRRAHDAAALTQSPKPAPGWWNILYRAPGE